MENSNLQLGINALRNGGILMHPTETCYGLAVDIFNEEALGCLYRVKGMSEGKPLSILVADLQMAQEYGVFGKKALELSEKYWPGALSILVPRTQKLPSFFNRGPEFVSIRISSNEFCRGMVKELGRPVTTTSANKAGEREFYEVREIEGVDCVVDGGKLSGNKPSTIVKVEGDELTILRQGDLVLEEVN